MLNSSRTTDRQIWTWREVLAISLLSAGALLGGTVVSSFALRSLTVTSDQPLLESLLFNAGLTALEGFALIGSIYLLAVRMRGIKWRELGLRPFESKWLLITITTTLIGIPIIGLVAYLIQIALGLPLENPQLAFLVPENFSWIGALLIFISGGLLVPFAEELFFRGMIYQWLRQKWSPWLANFVSSSLFGLLHGDLAIAGATFTMGLLLAWIFERSQSLWPAIAIHVINNSFKLILLYLAVATGMPIR